MTKEQLEAIITEKIEGQIKGMGVTITEEVQEKMKDEIKKIMSEKPKIEGLMEGDLDPKPRTADPKAGFKSFPEFAISVKNAEVTKGRVVDKRLDALTLVEKTASTTSVNESTAEYGGYLIPEEFRNTLLEVAIEKSNIMAMAQTIPMATNAINIPYVAGMDRSGGTLHGGIQWYWLDEEGTKTESRPKFGKIAMRLKKIAGLVYASDEILEDSPVSLEPLLTRMFSDAMAWQLDETFINGSGAGKPLGILNAPCLYSVTKETGQDAATIVYENIIKMYMHMHSKGNMIWMANDETFTQLASMSLSVGTGGVPVWMPAGGISGKPFDTLMGKPLVFTEHCQALGTKGDILACDWSQYLIGQKSGQSVQYASSIHLKFDADQTAFRFVFRIDGQPWWPTYITPLHGTNYLSPFISLDTRA